MKRISMLFAVVMMIAMIGMIVHSSAPPGNSESAIMVDHTFALMDSGVIIASEIASGPRLKSLRSDQKNPTTVERPLDFEAQTNGVEPAIVIRS